MTTPQQTYEKYVNKKEDGCWQWNACKVKGYGAFSVGNKHYRAHRFSYEYHKGAIPAGMYVLHTCDNSLCSNPHHLYLGTQQDNVRDRVSRKRSKYLSGDAAPWSKLTSNMVLQIKSLLKNCRRGMQKQIAKQFNIHEATLSDIKYGKTWKELS